MKIDLDLKKQYKKDTAWMKPKIKSSSKLPLHFRISYEFNLGVSPKCCKKLMQIDENNKFFSFRCSRCQKEWKNKE